MEHTHHHVSALVMGLRRWDFPRSSHGVVELVPWDQALTVHIIATSDSRSSRYRGWTVLLFKISEMLVMERCQIHTAKDDAP